MGTRVAAVASRLRRRRLDPPPAGHLHRAPARCGRVGRLRRRGRLASRLAAALPRRRRHRPRPSIPALPPLLSAVHRCFPSRSRSACACWALASPPSPRTVAAASTLRSPVVFVARSLDVDMLWATSSPRPPRQPSRRRSADPPPPPPPPIGSTGPSFDPLTLGGRVVGGGGDDAAGHQGGGSGCGGEGGGDGGRGGDDGNEATTVARPPNAHQAPVSSISPPKMTDEVTRTTEPQSGDEATDQVTATATWSPPRDRERGWLPSRRVRRPGGGEAAERRPARLRLRRNIPTMTHRAQTRR